MLKYLYQALKKQKTARSIYTGLNKTAIGRNLVFGVRHLAGQLPAPDPAFPQLISLEVASICNLSCVHCPPQQKGRNDQTRTLGLMDIGLFERLMDQADAAGPRRIALHKDGEPLLHPQIARILRRVKANHDHQVYLTTNGTRLEPGIGQEILDNRIDIVNFSLGAATAGFYAKVRGGDFGKVMRNLDRFLEAAAVHTWHPRIIAQIINLPEYPEMTAEITDFKKYWDSRGIEVQVWEKLNWGVYDEGSRQPGRYPCYSLWESFTVNSDGLVSACCMDWRQKLVIGDANQEGIARIWAGQPVKKLRQAHIQGREHDLPLCGRCNYWSWQPRLWKYWLE